MSFTENPQWPIDHVESLLVAAEAQAFLRAQAQKTAHIQAFAKQLEHTLLQGAVKINQKILLIKN